MFLPPDPHWGKKKTLDMEPWKSNDQTLSEELRRFIWVRGYKTCQRQLAAKGKNLLRCQQTETQSIKSSGREEERVKEKRGGGWCGEEGGIKDQDKEEKEAVEYEGWRGARRRGTGHSGGTAEEGEEEEIVGPERLQGRRESLESKRVRTKGKEVQSFSTSFGKFTPQKYIYKVK